MITTIITSTTAQAETAPGYSGFIITWNNTNNQYPGDLAGGKYIITTYDPASGFTVTDDERTGWGGGLGAGGQLISVNNDQDRNTLRFAADTYGQTDKAPVYTFNGLVLAGIIVDEGATGFSISSKGGGARKIYLGNNNATVAYSSINEDFTITRNFGTSDSKVYMRGTQVIEVASEKTYTIFARDGIDISGSITLQGGGTLALSGAVTLAKTITNNSAINFGGTVTLSDSLIGFAPTGACVDYKGVTASNGYAGVLDYTIVKGNVGGLSTVTWNGQTKEVVDGKITIGDSVDYSTYHLFTAGATLDLAAELQNNSELTKVSMQADTSLNVDTNFEGATIEAIGVNNVVNITEGKTLTGCIQNAVITGSGTYALNSDTPTLGAGTILDENWTGTVRIGGFSSGSSTHLDNFANGNASTVEICGITGGYLPEYSGGTVGTNIKLTNPGSSTPAWIWSNGSRYSNYTITFSGNWSGDGTFRKTGNYNQSFAFSGDISEWRGAFEYSSDSGYTSNLTFKGSATMVNAAIKKPGSGTLNLIVGDGQSSFSTTFKNTVEASSLTVQEHAMAILGADATISDSLTLHGLLKTDGGSLSLGDHATVQIGAAMSMEANKGGEINVSDNTAIEAARMYGTDDKGVLNNVNVDILDDYTIENMSISGSLIDVGEGTKLYLVNVDIHSDTHITDEAAWLDMQATNAWLDENNAHVMGRHVTTENTTLYLSGDPSQAITMAAGRVVVELTSDMFDTVTMTGGEPGVDLWLDMTAIADAFEGADYVALDFRDLAREFSNAMVDVEKLQVNVTLDGETYKQAYAMTDHGTTTTLYFAVPEPTTSTLSLLALAALAARRRRTL